MEAVTGQHAASKGPAVSVGRDRFARLGRQAQIDCNADIDSRPMIGKRPPTAVVWFACIAQLLAALGLSIGQALAPGAARGGLVIWAEVCTLSGNRLVGIDGGKSDPAPVAPATHLFHHCPCCSLHVTALGMPPNALSVPAQLRFGLQLPEPMLRVARTLFAWTAAQPRGPPLQT